MKTDGRNVRGVMRVRKTLLAAVGLLWLGGVCAASAGGVSIPKSALDPAGGHIQGIAVGDGGAVYVSQMTQLLKLDRDGKVLAAKKVTSHTGDVTWWKGELYTAVAVYPDCKEGRIEVFDKDLNLVRSAKVDRTVDGIACLDGVLYVGMGSKSKPSKVPHRVNVLGRFDAATLKEIAPRQDFDYGYDTKYGFQDIATDGKLLYATFYAAKGAPIMAVFDKGGAVVGVSDAGSNNGFDFLPEGGGLLEQRKGVLTVRPLPTVRNKACGEQRSQSPRCHDDFDEGQSSKGNKK